MGAAAAASESLPNGGRSKHSRSCLVSWIDQRRLEGEELQAMERTQERLIRTDVDRARFVAIGNPDLLVLQLREQTDIIGEPKALPKPRCSISGLVAGAVEERRHQAA